MTNRQIARQIYFKLFRPPKTHQEWANSFNLIGVIERVIDKKKNGTINENKQMQGR